ncbi:MAG: di-trans,poly-cis-decaprenylcistransferase [Gammaproteobacteria bacterium RIFOXYB2_FULL_38_6]|nr:MAG: di-trans,poly-cis-decaprenylcistransferase [Gammaproteobacteria bacterium RIFOXYB2_FULL_38_6]
MSPNHIAIIMDGNGRWAKQHKLPRLAGHHQGVKTVRRIVEYCGKLGIPTLTLFAFSVENQNRPLKEVSGLMSLFMSAIKKYMKELHEKNVRVKMIGDRSLLSKKLNDEMSKIEKLTEKNSRLTLVLAIQYSGRWDIVRASQKIAKAVSDKKMSVDDVNEETFANRLDTAELSEPDLLIRTSGEERISNFMLWQCAYTEFYFSKLFWPDFDEKELDKAIAVFLKRQRRFGKTGEQV